MPIITPPQNLPPAGALSQNDVAIVGQGASAVRKTTLATLKAFILAGLPAVVNGVDGRTVLYGAAPPANVYGRDGDFYINKAAWVIYGPKVAGAWPAGVTMLGTDTPLDDAIADGAPGASLVTRSAAKIAQLITAAVAPKANTADVNAAIGDLAASRPALDDVVADDQPDASLVTRSAAKIGALITAAIAALKTWIAARIGKVPEDFGAIGGGVADDKVALQAWLDSGGLLYFPPKTYRSSGKLYARKRMVVLGAGSDWGALNGSVILYDASVTGKAFDVQPNTPLTDCAAVIAAGAGAFTQEGAFGSSFRDFALRQVPGGNADGFYCRTYFHASNVNCWDFGGKGHDYSASGDAGDGNSEFGNMSNSDTNNCGSYFCGGHALHARGRDANTMSISNFTFFSCGGWGILNETVIPNLYIKPQGANCTLGALKEPPFTGSTYVLPFVEADAHNNCELNGNCIVIGTSLNNTTGKLTTYNQRPAFPMLTIHGSEPPEALTGEYGKIFNWDGLSFIGRGSAKDVAFYNYNGGLAAYVPTNSTGFHVVGTLTGHGHITAISAYDSTVFGSRFQTGGINSAWPGLADGYATMYAHGTNGLVLGGYGTSYDTSLFNRAGSFAMGVVANSLDVRFKGAALSDGGGIGYAAGAGNVAVQGTSRATVVTLNKVTGKITLFSTTTAAGEMATFTWNNSQLGATDTISWAQLSGAGVYFVSAKNNGDGTATVSIYTPAAVGAAEAPAFQFNIIKGAQS